MRTDENGFECPSTLGEYREICAEIGKPNNAAIRWLDEKIAAQGADQKVIASDLEMRHLLVPMLFHE